MDYTSKNPVLQASQADLFIDTLEAELLTGDVVVHLYKAGPATPTPQNVLADFTECDFTGYNEVTITITGGLKLTVPNGNARALFLQAMFIASAVLSPGQDALGFYVTNDVSNLLYYSESFPSPFPFVTVGDFLDLMAFIPIFWIGSVS